MPTLDWIGKKAVVNHHREVPYHVLRCDSALSVGEPGSGNLLIQGDNLLALKALLPYYAGKVKCIYFDPPYNTGKEGWIYNDNVNSPEIREWLGKVVGKDAEDLSRHDKWLCMMYPRLRLAQQFLHDQGLLFVSIDDNEVHRLREVLDEVMRPTNLLACIVWQTEGNFDNQAKVKIAHEYVLAYAKDMKALPPLPVVDPSTPEGSKLFKPEIRNTVVKNGPKNPVSEFRLPVGFPAAFQQGVIEPRKDKWPHYADRVVIRDFRVATEAVAKSGWSSKRLMSRFVASGFNPVKDTKGQTTSFELTMTGAIEAFKPRSELQSHVVSVIREVGTTQNASAFLSEMGLKFDYPKPVGLIRYLVSMVADRDAVTLDFFAGSGTTAQAVMEANKADGGNRHFVLAEVDATIAEGIAQKRLDKLVNGYRRKDGEGVPGLGGGFRFCRLGPSLLDANGQVAAEIKFDDLARHVWFCETGEPWPVTGKGKRTPLLGAHNDTGIYLLFNGVLGDRAVNGGNVVTTSVLAALPKHKGPKVIYGEASRLGKERLKREGIVFKQIPYEVKGA